MQEKGISELNSANNKTPNNDEANTRKWLFTSATISKDSVSVFPIPRSNILTTCVEKKKNMWIYLCIPDARVWFYLFPSSHLFPVGLRMNDVKLICQLVNAEQVSESTSRGRPCHMTVPSTMLCFYFFSHTLLMTHLLLASCTTFETLALLVCMLTLYNSILLIFSWPSKFPCSLWFLCFNQLIQSDDIQSGTMRLLQELNQDY